MEYKENVTLLLLQLLLYRQQELAHKDKSLSYENLLKHPIVDEEILLRFKSHKLVRLYAPHVSDMQVRGLRSIVQDTFTKGIPDGNNDKNKNEQLTLLELANYYYRKRIQDLQQEEIPKLKELIETNMGDKSTS